MSITYTPDASTLVELAAIAETTYGTYLDPTSGAGGVQIATSAPPDFGQGHTPIQGAAMTGTIQEVITHAAIRGLDLPYVNFESPLSANAITTLFHMWYGTAVTSNEWAVSNSPAGFSVGVHMQRSAGGGDYYKFAGTRVATANLTMPLGGMPTLRLGCIARTLGFPATSPSTFPTLTPATAYRPFILQDCSLLHGATSSAADSGTVVKIRGFDISTDLGLLVEHNSTATHPDSIVRTMFRTTGTIQAHYSADWWSEWRTIIAGESSTGFTTRYLRFTLNDGTNVLRFKMPVKLDISGFAADGPAMGANITFTAAGDDATPTVATIKATNV